MFSFAISLFLIYPGIILSSLGISPRGFEASYATVSGGRSSFEREEWGWGAPIFSLSVLCSSFTLSISILWFERILSLSISTLSYDSILSISIFTSFGLRVQLYQAPKIRLVAPVSDLLFHILMPLFPTKWPCGPTKLQADKSALCISPRKAVENRRWGSCWEWKNRVSWIQAAWTKLMSTPHRGPLVFIL